MRPPLICGHVVTSLPTYKRRHIIVDLHPGVKFYAMWLPSSLGAFFNRASHHIVNRVHSVPSSIELHLAVVTKLTR